MSHWNLKRAARLGYLAGRGLSVESNMARSAPRWSGLFAGRLFCRCCVARIIGQWSHGSR
jgi:hypothetical protein